MRVDALFFAHVDLVGGGIVTRGLDGWACPIVDSMALQLTKREPAMLQSLLEFEDESGDEIPGERWRIFARWASICRAYVADYFPRVPPEIPDRPSSSFDFYEGGNDR